MRRTATALFAACVLTACTGSATGLDNQARIQASIGPGETDQHVVTASASGVLLAELTWNNRNVDLDLYITGTACVSDPLSSCAVLAVSNDIFTTREATGVSAAPGDQFKLWVENLDGVRTVNYGLDYEVMN